MVVRVMRQVFHTCSEEMYGRSDERLQAHRRVHSLGGMGGASGQRRSAETIVKNWKGGDRERDIIKLYKASRLD